MPGFLSPGKGVPLLLIPEYSGINKGPKVSRQIQNSTQEASCYMLPDTPGSRAGLHCLRILDS